MIPLCLLLVFSASVLSESVRETETWMPMKTTQTVAMSTQDVELEASGDSPNGSDFGFTDGYDSDTLYDDEDGYEDFSGSGDRATTVTPPRESRPSDKSNEIPEPERPVRPTIDEGERHRDTNEIPFPRNEQESNNPSNVLMSQTGESIFNKTEVLAALIAGGAVGLLFAVLLILLLIYRMKKKDEGSYDLGKKPIYKKAPTTEIYA